MIKKLINLVEVRKIITLSFAALFIYLATTASVSNDFITTTLTMVFGYYFGRSTALDKGEVK